MSNGEGELHLGGSASLMLDLVLRFFKGADTEQIAHGNSERACFSAAPSNLAPSMIPTVRPFRFSKRTFAGGHSMEQLG